MTMEDESSYGGSVDQKMIAPMTAIERFHARKFRGKDDSCTGKWVALKITGVGRSKKQRTPVKAHMKEALSALVDSEVSRRTKRIVDDTDTDRQEMDTAMEANLSIVDPRHLMETHDESHQEQ
jgi:hypothetical protein